MVDIKDRKATLYPIVYVNPINPMNIYPEFQVLTADKAASEGLMPLPATR
jgi:hypothetical protein